MRKKFLCPLPWKELAITSSGSVRVCCSAPSSLALSKYSNGRTAKAWDEIDLSYNTKIFQETRTAMLNDEIPSLCQGCKTLEDHGLSSPRTNWLKAYSQDELSALSGPTTRLEEIRQLDIRLSNKCNLKCRMCNPYSSSSWVQDWKNLGDLVEQPDSKEWPRLAQGSWSKHNDFLSQFKTIVPNLRSIYISGGEPFLNSMNEQILDECISGGYSSNIGIRYNTNGTVWPEHLVQKWYHFKNVDIKFSIDAVDRLNDYIRYPSRFESVRENLKKAIESTQNSNLSVAIVCTVQIYNIFALPEIVKFAQSLNLNINFDLLHEPQFLSIQALPKNLVERIVAGSNLHLIPEFKNIVSVMNSELSHLWPQFLAYTQKLDSIRGQNSEQFLPRYYFEK